MIVSVLITLLFFHHFYFMVFLYTAHDHVFTLFLTFMPSVSYMEHNLANTKTVIPQNVSKLLNIL